MQRSTTLKNAEISLAHKYWAAQSDVTRGLAFTEQFESNNR
jgi:hypothetical protein